ncbi:MAG TPA: hypothetical protein VF332_07455 [Vicinamibacterales bacterium]
MASELSKDELKRLARLGAQARLQQIEEERRSILRAFPGLAAAIARQKPAETTAGTPAAEAPKKKRRKRRKMTAAEKKAASERMKKVWAARRQRQG